MGRGPPCRPRPQQWFFDAWARVYDLPPVQYAVYRPVQNAVAGALRRRRVERLLDVGCGTGILTARLRRELGATCVTGLDFSAGMLAQARARDPGIALVRGDGGRLPNRDGVLDAIVATESFHWLPDPDGALAEFRRVLRSSGLLLRATVNPRLELTGPPRARRLASGGTAVPLADRLRAGGQSSPRGLPGRATGAHPALPGRARLPAH